MVQVNGKAYEVAGMTVEQLMLQFEYDAKKIAVEINEEIVPKLKYKETVVKDDDVVEVVSFVGGG